MSDNICSFCIYFAKPDDSKVRSECRYFPPNIIVNDGGVFSRWPKVNDDDWCGCFESVLSSSSESSERKFGFHHGQGV